MCTLGTMLASDTFYKHPSGGRKMHLTHTHTRARFISPSFQAIQPMPDIKALAASLHARLTRQLMVSTCLLRVV